MVLTVKINWLKNEYLFRRGQLIHMYHTGGATPHPLEIDRHHTVSPVKAKRTYKPIWHNRRGESIDLQLFHMGDKLVHIRMISRIYSSNIRMIWIQLASAALLKLGF